MIHPNLHDSHESRVHQFIDLVLHGNTTVAHIDEWCQAHSNDNITAFTSDPVQQSVLMTNRAAGLEAIARLTAMDDQWSIHPPDSRTHVFCWFYGRIADEPEDERRLMIALVYAHTFTTLNSVRTVRISECIGVWKRIRRPQPPTHQEVLS